jgi:hypothetical protein
MVLKKIVFGLFLTGILLCTLSYVALGDVHESTSQEWQIEDRGGYYSESDETIRLRSSGGGICPGITLYKQIAPVTDFNFSLQVTAATLESFGIFVRSSLPFSGSKEGVNFEFGHYGAGMFLLARQTSMDDWIGSHFADGFADVWYTMQLSIYANSFRIVAEVLDENGTLLGSISVSDMNNISFGDIKYLGFGVWGYNATDYSVKNIICPFDNLSYDNPSYISISTELSSILAGSAVNVIGTLSDSNGTPLQSELVVLSYTFAGIDSWIPISSSLTNEAGEYNIQWINSASGTFTLKTEWNGNATFTGVSNTTTLSFVPHQSQQVFFVASNSTVSALAFNSTSSELSFTVIGPTGTSGYVKATIAKSITTNGEDAKVYLDGKQLNYSVISTDDSWLITFSYSHSTHQISMNLGANTSSTKLLEVDYVFWAVIITLTFAGAIIGGVIWKRRKSTQAV